MILKLNVYFYTRHCGKHISVFQKVVVRFFLTFILKNLKITVKLKEEYNNENFIYLS